jgi:hypothetical protein
LLRIAQAAKRDSVYVSRRMNQSQFAVAGRFSQCQLQLRQFGGQSLAQQFVLAHGKAVSGGQGLNMRSGKVNMHAGLLVMA